MTGACASAASDFPARFAGAFEGAGEARAAPSLRRQSGLRAGVEAAQKAIGYEDRLHL